jgi:hypothetical protein
MMSSGNMERNSLFITISKDIDLDTKENREKFILESFNKLIDSYELRRTFENLSKKMYIEIISVYQDMGTIAGETARLFQSVSNKKFEQPLKTENEIITELCKVIYGEPLTEDILLIIRMTEYTFKREERK